MLDIETILPGDEVYWTDPDEGQSSGYYTIKTVTINKEDPAHSVLNISNGTSKAEVYLKELS